MGELKKTVTLNHWQKQVWSDSHRFLILNCGRRAGKSTYSALKIATFVQSHPNSIVYYVSPSYKQSKSIMWELLKEFIPKHWIVSVHDTDLRLILRNGAKIELKGADTDPDKLRGVRIDYLVCDEVASFRNWDIVWNKVLRPTLLDSKGSAIFISTPLGFNFWYDLYKIEDADYKSYTFSTYDNEHIDVGEIDKLKRELDNDTFRQEILAQFTQVSGVVYKEWDFIKQFIPLVYDPYLPLHITMDFGVNDPTSIIWIQKNSGEFRAIDFYEAPNTSIEQVAQILRAKPYKTPDFITGDPAGKARSIVTNTSPIDELARYNYFVSSRDGVQIVDQIRITHKYIKSFYISNTIPILRDHLHNYRYPTKKANIVNQSNEVPIHDEHSHSLRALEYYFTNIDGDQLDTNYLTNDFSKWKI